MCTNYRFVELCTTICHVSVRVKMILIRILISVCVVCLSLETKNMFNIWLSKLKFVLKLNLLSMKCVKHNILANIKYSAIDECSSLSKPGGVACIYRTN